MGPSLALSLISSWLMLCDKQGPKSGSFFRMFYFFPFATILKYSPHLCLLCLISNRKDCNVLKSFMWHITPPVCQVYQKSSQLSARCKEWKREMGNHNEKECLVWSNTVVQADPGDQRVSFAFVIMMTQRFFSRLSFHFNRLWCTDSAEHSIPDKYSKYLQFL